MRYMFKVLVALAFIGVVTSSTARAQVQTGSILVTATDEQGAMTPGVTITISSPVLVAGSMTGVTDSAGVYRFPSLVPGTYSIKLDLQGFQSVVRENVAVLVGQTTPVQLALKVATVAETVTVTGASPVVDTTSANVNVNLSEQLLQGTPGGRDIWALVETKFRASSSRDPTWEGPPAVCRVCTRARDDHRAELPVSERHQRRRPERDRRGGLLLRLRRLRRHSGLDGRARHHGSDRRRLPQHGDEERWQHMAGPRHLRVGRQRHTEREHRRQPAALRLHSGNEQGRLRLGRELQRGRTGHREQVARVRIVSRLARARERAGGLLGDGARPDQHRLGPRQCDLSAE